MILVFYKLNSAIERGTKPDVLGWKPCHWTSTIDIIVNNPIDQKVVEPSSSQHYSLVGSCTCPIRINIAGSPVDCHRDKKAWTRGLSWHPGGPFTPGDALTAGRADTPT